MSEVKTCRVCQAPFTVEDEDLDFYQKMSPTFGDKTFPIPSPSLCPACRDTRRLAWRNELTFYKRKSDKSGKEIVSIYAPDSPFTVYAIDEWWQDDWDGTQYAQEYDASRPFFEQFNDLFVKVPKRALYNTKTEDSEYVNYATECKNSYMSSILSYNTENTYYSYWATSCVNNSDIMRSEKAENSYFSYGLKDSYGCKYSVNLDNCRECYYSLNLSGCQNCILSNNLRNKQYYVRNKQVTKEEYKHELAALNMGSWQSFKKHYQEFLQMKNNAIVPFTKHVSCEDSTGDELTECKNVQDCFLSFRLEDSRYSYGIKASHIYDSRVGSSEWVLESGNAMGTVLISCVGTMYSNFMYYCSDCFSCNECFGCVGLRNKKYHIFNQEYTRDEYYQKVSEIVSAMTAAGEWGEFYPIKYSPFAYNETIAQTIYPKTKEEAVGFGWRWKDNISTPDYQGKTYEPKDDINDYIKSEEERNSLLAGVIRCEQTGKPFKIIPRELALYIKTKTPIPRYHYSVRMDIMFENLNKPVLYHRQCMCEDTSHNHHANGRCPNEFETVYAENRTEKVYCESCYQQVI